MTKLKNAVGYFGGKGNQYNTIHTFFPDYKENKITTYIEPFSGAYNVGLYQPNPPETEIYNDLWNNVYSLYKVISDKELFENFKQKADLMPYSETLNIEFKKQLKRDDLDIEDRAFYYFYVNRTSRNGVGGFSINLITRRKMSKSVSDYLSTVDGLYDLHQRMSKVIVLNRNAIDVIKKYDFPYVFMYCDSPYSWSTRTSARYAVDMNHEQQQEYLETLLNTKNAKMLISGYKCEEYEILERNGWERIDFEVKTVSGTNQRKTKVESLWKNY